MIRGVVFDLFHTLVDPEDWATHFHRGVALADLIGVNKEEFALYWKETAVLRYSTRKASVEYVKDFAVRAGKNVSSELLDRAADIIGRYQDLAILNPRAEVTESLRLLRQNGLKMGLLSNAEQGEVRSWPRSPLAGFFDSVAFSYDTGRLKPDFAAYQSILEELGLDAGFCAYVGDGGSQELLGARKAMFSKVVFMRQFVATNGVHTDEQLRQFLKQADIVIDNFSELPTKLFV